MAAVKELNIFQRMALATSEIETVSKNLAVQVSKTSSYKAVGEKDILDAVKPIENKYGIYSFPVSRRIIESGIQERETQYGVNKQLFMRLEVVYRFVNIDDPEDYIEVTSYGDGIDSGDKATGKAMTYADKYALMKAYKISTGDDPDKEASTKLSNKPKPMTERQYAIIEKMPDAWKQNIIEHHGTLALTFEQAVEVIDKWNDAQQRAKAKAQNV